MIKRTNTKIKAIILDMFKREAGSFINDKGQEVSYDEAIKVHYIREDDPKNEVIKGTVAKEAERMVSDSSKSVQWGSIAELIIRNNQIISVELLNVRPASQQKPN